MIIQSFSNINIIFPVSFDLAILSITMPPCVPPLSRLNMATPPVIGLTTECLAFTQTLVFLLFLWKQWQRHHSICSDTDYGSMYVQNEGGMPDHQKLRPSETLNVIPQLRGRGASHTSQPDHKHLWKCWPTFPLECDSLMLKHISFHCEGAENAHKKSRNTKGEGVKPDHKIRKWK